VINTPTSGRNNRTNPRRPPGRPCGSASAGADGSPLDRGAPLQTLGGVRRCLQVDQSTCGHRSLRSQLRLASTPPQVLRGVPRPTAEQDVEHDRNERHEFEGEKELRNPKGHSFASRGLRAGHLDLRQHRRRNKRAALSQNYWLQLSFPMPPSTNRQRRARGKDHDEGCHDQSPEPVPCQGSKEPEYQRRKEAEYRAKIILPYSATRKSATTDGKLPLDKLDNAATLPAAAHVAL